ncbi:MAG: FecR domain-containing protein [Myxococcota bacterium]
MIALLMWMWVPFADAAGHRVLRSGESIESVAAEEGVDPVSIRSINGLAADQTPPVGTILMLPETGTIEAQQAQVLTVTGGGRITLPEGEVVALRCGVRMEPGTVICTDVESFATIRLASARSGAVFDDIRMSGSTCLTLISTAAGDAAGRQSLVNLSEGSVQVDRAADDAGTITVQTPMSLTTARSGSFRVTMEEEAVRTEALTDNVVVMAEGEEVSLDAGEGSRVRSGDEPTAPVPLLDTGFLLKPDNDTPLLRPDFAWTPVEQALGYRIQIATGPDFSRILYQEDLPYPEWRPDFLLLPFDVPALWWRVSSFDRFGFESPPSAPRRLKVPTGVRP